MCGPTGAQTTLQSEQIAAYEQAQQLTSEQYSRYKAITDPLVQKFQSIFNQGPSQEGFSTEQKNDLNAQTVEGTAENYKSAARSLNESEAAEGGGNNPLPSGGQDQLKEELANSAVQEQSKEETGVQEEDWNRGYEEWLNAGRSLEGIASGTNPVGYENAATGAGSTADTEANAIAAEQDQWISAVSGAVGAIGGGLAGNPKLFK